MDSSQKAQLLVWASGFQKELIKDLPNAATVPFLLSISLHKILDNVHTEYIITLHI